MSQIVCQCHVFLLVIFSMNHDVIVSKTLYTCMWNIISDNIQFLLWSIKSDIKKQYVCWKEALFLPLISSTHCKLTALLLINFFFFYLIEPFYGWGSTFSRLQRHYKESYLLPLHFTYQFLWSKYFAVQVL